ncbi:MAG: lytic transglycosylase domain-containing protein [bacterium]|nr:lytic transglycosylase domain-containing protein [bacterium]
MKQCAWRLVTTLTLLALLHSTAMAQSSVSAQPSLQVKRDITRLLVDTLPDHNIDPQRLPGRFQRQVIKRVYEYTALYRRDMQNMLQRATPFLPMMKRTLKQHGLPAYFAYIPMVESAFRVNASHPKSGARGLWQLMPATARGYGLKVSSHIDERIDPKRATQAAARYLKNLQKRFGRQSPLHILAAYNHGDANLAKAMRRHRTRDIWHLYTYRYLPYQTRDYLIKMVTLWVVMAHADYFDFTLDDTVFPALYSALTPPSAMAITAVLQHSPAIPTVQND